MWHALNQFLHKDSFIVIVQPFISILMKFRSKELLEEAICLFISTWSQLNSNKNICFAFFYFSKFRCGDKSYCTWLFLTKMSFNVLTREARGIKISLHHTAFFFPRFIKLFFFFLITFGATDLAIFFFYPRVFQYWL